MGVNYDGTVRSDLREMALVLESLPVDAIQDASERVIRAYEDDRTIYIFGNGGSASTATHFACDLSKAPLRQDARRPRALSLNDNVALLTAWSNDQSFESAIAEQVRSLVRAGDVVIAISASGRSANIIEAVGAARQAGASVIGLAGFDGGELAILADVPVVVQSEDYGWIESAHVIVHHLITYALREHMVNREKVAVPV